MMTLYFQKRQKHLTFYSFWILKKGGRTFFLKTLQIVLGFILHQIKTSITNIYDHRIFPKD